MGDNSSVVNKKIQKKVRSNIILKTFYKIIFIVALIVIFLMYFVNKYKVSTKNIYSLIGNAVSTSINSRDALYIREFSIIPFGNFLSNGDFESAYAMCTDDYRNCFTIDEFRNLFENVDFSSFQMKEIKAKSDLCYEAVVEYKQSIPSNNVSGDDYKEVMVEQTYLLFPNEFNTDLIKIAPNGFLYGYKDLVFEKSGIQTSIEKCIVYKNHVDLKGSIKNTAWFSKLELANIALGYDSGLVRRFDFLETIEKGETVPFEHTIEDTTYFMPNNIQIEKIKNPTKLKVFTFYFEDAK